MVRIRNFYSAGAGQLYGSSFTVDKFVERLQSPAEVAATFL